MRVRLVWLGFNRHLHIIAMELFTAPLQRPAQKSVFFLFFPKTNVSPHVAVIRQPVELTAPPKSIRFSAVSREKQTYAVLRLGFRRARHPLFFHAIRPLLRNFLHGRFYTIATRHGLFYSKKRRNKRFLCDLVLRPPFCSTALLTYP